MRAKLVNEGWAEPPMGGYRSDAYYKQQEKEFNAKWRAEEKARNEIQKTYKKAYVLPIGVVSPANGSTMYDWNIYDTWPNGWAFLVGGGHGYLLFSAREDDFDIGEDVLLMGNDSGRKLKAGKITDKAPVIKDELINMLFKNKYDYKPKRAFQKAQFGNKLSTSYSVKGIE